MFLLAAPDFGSMALYMQDLDGADFADLYVAKNLVEPSNPVVPKFWNVP